MQKPNYTQLSNQFIDEKMATISGNAAKIFVAISRKTIGFHKDTDAIAYTQIIKMTGISSRTTVKKAIDELIQNGLIVVDKIEGGTTKYTLNMTSTEIVPPTSTENVPHQYKNCTTTGTETVLTKESLKETSQKKIYTSVFETFWESYPRHTNKRGAFKAWSSRLKEKVDSNELIVCAKQYAKLMRGKDQQYIMHASTFLGPNERYKDFIQKEDDKPKTVTKTISVSAADLFKGNRRTYE